MFSADEGWRVAETMFKFTFQFICDCSVCIGGAFRTSVTVKLLQTQRGVLCYNQRIFFSKFTRNCFQLVSDVVSTSPSFTLLACACMHQCVRLTLFMGKVM